MLRAFKSEVFKAFSAGFLIGTAMLGVVIGPAARAEVVQAIAAVQ